MLNTDIRTSPSDADDFAAILAEQTDRLLSRQVTPAVLTAADAGVWPHDAWAAAAEAGLPWAMVAEEAGGAGLATAAAGQILRRSGFHALPAPLGETIIGLALWSAAGGTPVKEPVTLATSAILSPGAGGGDLEGTLPRVPWASQAGHLLLAVREADGESRLVLLPRAAYTTEPGRNLANEPRESVCIATSLDPQMARPAPPGLAGPDGLALFGAFLRAQQMAGAMQRCLELAIAYANERRQFGKPIGRFQAVQHMLAVAAGESAAAAAAAQLAAANWGTGRFPFAVAVAKVRCGEAAGKVAEACHQVHGAMGFTQEHILHFFTRRLWAWRDECGNEAHWAERIASVVCSEGGEALWPRLVATRAGGATRGESRP